MKANFELQLRAGLRCHLVRLRLVEGSRLEKGDVVSIEVDFGDLEFRPCG